MQHWLLEYFIIVHIGKWLLVDSNKYLCIGNVLFLMNDLDLGILSMSSWLLFPPCVSPSSLANIPLTPETARDQERRIRREIANSNERRRMQSINAGFQSLKTLIPHSDGEKLSKVGHKQRFEFGELSYM